ncbi:MAG: DUF2244 domain-containing protein [Acidisphaera sp.]|nr:DUF2244 domain-containing protein [Acidisphaera sp.]MBV9812788.1 DUF2244 domain-containing protein [Acetobacteraceae bacterium]
MTDAPEAALFEAVIVPHRSLSPRALNRLLLAIGALCGVNATVSVLIGAWPVAGFTGIELFVAALLFRIHALSARGSEVVILTASGLRIRRTSPRGERQDVVLPPFWLRVVWDAAPSRIPRLWLVAHGTREEIGSVLGEDAKRDLCRALQDALWRWRNPVFDNPQLRDP